ncbi:ABC transporter ATP-binding protein YtrE [Rubripirellula amarantea]|uniref:ABC transporter ATP-binding protein YtrE n=1 Tax=Rubripirellula amarantea TaxID=2527999 RepID=A0A5C5WKI3_9BACT|nr:ABC transporter ATP-binding protein [Rubripirellula amarantea]TWT51117.1 ABC transporter ATP-binding protein YtrE [Rubripirellula amarantea]
MKSPALSTDPVVLVQDVCKEYRRNDNVLTVLHNMNLQLAAGDYLALMGPSGSGKSTLLNLIAGLDQPTSGHIYVCGEDLATASQSKLAKWRSRHVGFIFQMYNLIPVLTAYENVELPLTLTPLNRKQRKAQVQTALEIVGLADRMDHYPTQLSGGQEQRVSIARAIATDPTLIVADEPTGDLDAKSGTEILELMGRLNEEFGKTIVMVTHDPRAAGFAKRTMHLEDGRLVGDTDNPGAVSAVQEHNA